MADSKKKKSKKEDDSGSKKRAVRSGSNVFAAFSQHQVQEFKEAFQMIDQDKDGFISKNDIRQTFDSLGRLCTESELDSMIQEAPGPINFTMFLTIFGDRVSGTDDEATIISAFTQFDEGEGKCKEDKLKLAITTFGEKFSNEEWKTCVAEAPVDHTGKIDLRRWAKMITGQDEEEAAA